MSSTILTLGILFSIFTGLAGAQPAWVKDTDGQPLKAGTYYYVLPAQSSSFGGLYSASRNRVQCPLYVTQIDMSTVDGVPARFAPVNGMDLVPLSTDLNVESYNSNICPDPTVWTLAPVDKKTRQTFVKYGGVAGSPGRATLRNWFRIEEEGEHYKLVFCPAVCKTCRVRCGNLGVYLAPNDVRWLVLGGDTLPVKFKKSEKN
ncbi:kunitz trypsin inhibitor 5-like [Nymphaea colorata]|uniref:Uncharacterized protein n=1 Tax=Nymphaea colorata TaxID=210225 RepID=A0A5K1GIZ0_9MAGN|nr:kunitz trypsin inhibitor 5-like [Nymphaea colorata]